MFVSAVLLTRPIASTCSPLSRIRPCSRSAFCDRRSAAAPRVFHFPHTGMSDDVAGALREIVALLQARNEHTASMAQRAQEHMARFEVQKREMPDLAAMEAKQAAETRAYREHAARQREEDLAFRERLVSALERQNALLARLADRFAPE